MNMNNARLQRLNMLPIDCLMPCNDLHSVVPMDLYISSDAR